VRRSPPTPVISLKSIAFALVALLLAPFEVLAETESKRALCIVCHVEEGTSAPETVHATREYQGRTYRFCSDRCAGLFDKNPRKYAEAANAAPSDSMFQGGLFTSVSSAPT